MKYIIVNRAERRKEKEKEEEGGYWGEIEKLGFVALKLFVVEVLINIIEISLSLSD